MGSLADQLLELVGLVEELEGSPKEVVEATLVAPIGMRRTLALNHLWEHSERGLCFRETAIDPIDYAWIQAQLKELEGEGFVEHKGAGYGKGEAGIGGRYRYRFTFEGRRYYPRPLVAESLEWWSGRVNLMPMEKAVQAS